MKKKVIILTTMLFSVAVVTFLLSCFSIYENETGIMISGYVIKNDTEYYLTYHLDKDELVVGEEPKNSVNFGTYCDVDTSIVDVFLEEVKNARAECKTEHPEFEGYEKICEDGNTIYVFPQSVKISQYMNEKLNYETSIFKDYNETRKQFTDLGGYTIDVCEVPGTDGKIVFKPSTNCDEVVFYIMASKLNDDIKNMTYDEFYKKCNKTINPGKIQFSLPW